MVTQHTAAVQAIIDGDSKSLANCQQGQRNTRLFTIACNWKRLSNEPAWTNVHWSDLQRILRIAALNAGLPDNESVRTIDRAVKVTEAEELSS